MKKLTKRLLSWMLVICMLLSIMVTTAFAAEGNAFQSTATEVSGDDTFTVSFTQPTTVTVSGLSLGIAFDNTAFEITEIANAPYTAIQPDLSGCNTAGNVTIQYADSTSDANTTINAETVLLSATFKIKDGATVGAKEFKVTDYVVTGAFSEEIFDFELITPNDTVVGSKTLTVEIVEKEENPATEAYTATLSPATTTVNNDGTSKVSVDVVVGGTAGKFASTEIKLTYDPAYLTFAKDSSSCKLTATVPQGMTDQAVEFIDDGNGNLTIRDYGGTMTVAADGTAYTVAFTTVKGGNTEVSLTAAGFSEQEKAASENLIPANAGSKAAVTINHKASVTVDGVAGTTTYVTPNGSYTYQISDYNATNYKYTVTATEDNAAVNSERISIDNTGKVTISGVSGELDVTITKEAKSYNITWKDTDPAAITGEKPTTQNYGTGISFNVSAGSKPADSTQSGYYYDVKAYLTSDNAQTIVVTGTPADDNYVAKTYTIDASAITGDITIEVTKKTVDATQTTITIDGDYTELKINGEIPESASVTVPKNQAVTMTVTEADGYTYKVEIVVGETTTELSKDSDGNYTFTPSEALTLKVTKTLNTESLEVTQYVQLDGKIMWLVKINGLTNTDGKTYTYKASAEATAENFYWSAKYSLTGGSTTGAYCFLIVTDTDTGAETVKAGLAGKIGLNESAGATSISYNGNVNLTKNGDAAVIDMNDAQLVWNMYSAVYDEITADVTVQKFLEADMDGNGKVETEDAAKVVELIN